jgi:hypothetical protein
MIARHVHDALDQVERLRRFVLEKREFEGYSGRARMLGGVVALLGALSVEFFGVPRDALSVFIVWCSVLGVSLLLNYGALLAWFFRSGSGMRDFREIIPAVDAIPALAVGACLTVALPLKGEYWLLVPMWMFLYGLVHIPYRRNLPERIYLVGLFYIACGVWFLFFPKPFVNPWPMGLVFFLGEIAGGAVLSRGCGGDEVDDEKEKRDE